MWFGCGHISNPPFKKSAYAPGMNVGLNGEWVAEKTVRLLNVRLNMKLTVWPTMRLNGRLMNVRLNMKLTVWPTMRLNVGLNGRLGCVM